MKPTELRVGNIVKMELKGVEISGDALFDLGFSKRYDAYNLHIGEINIEVSKSGMGNFWWVSLNDCADLKVKYIHQIQNIISALTEDI